MALRLLVQREEEIRRLKEMFVELDEDGSGQLTLAEFARAFEIETIRNKLLLMGLSEDMLLQLFLVLDTASWRETLRARRGVGTFSQDGEGELDLATAMHCLKALNATEDEFMSGMQAMSGLASAKDMARALKRAALTAPRWS